MDQFCDRLMHRYFAEAMRALDATADEDKRVHEAAANPQIDRAERVRALAAWIRLYKVHRVRWKADGNARTFAEAVAGVAIDQFDGWARHAPEPADAYAALRTSIGTMHQQNAGEERSFRSLTAKVLWTWMPGHVPIYDELASNAVTFLVKVYKAHRVQTVYDRGEEEAKYDEDFASGEWDRLSKPQKDIWWYRDFARSHCALYEQFEPAIKRRLVTGGRGERFRLFDKFLWVLGNGGLDYSLLGYPREAERTPDRSEIHGARQIDFGVK